MGFQGLVPRNEGKSCDGCFTISLAPKARMSWSSHLALCVIDFVGTTGLGGAAPATRGSFRPMSDAGEPIEVVINGQSRTVIQGTTVAALIGELGLGDRRVAVERNREVV